MAAISFSAGTGTPTGSYGGGGTDSLLMKVLKPVGRAITAGQRGVGRVVEPIALELGQGADQLAALLPGALGSNSRSNIAAREAAGIRGFSVGELLNYGRDSTGKQVKLFDDPAFKDNGPIINGTLRFGLDVAEDPLNLIGLGTATKAGKAGTKLKPSILARDVLAKTTTDALLRTASPLALEEGGSLAAKILTTTGAKKGLGAALKEISTSPSALAAFEHAGYTTERGLMLGLSGNGLMVPGTAKIAQGIDRVNGAIGARGTAKILQWTDARDWQLGQRAARIRKLGADAEAGIAAGVPDALETFRKGVEADFGRSVVQGTKQGIFANIIEESRDSLGYATAKEADDAIEKEIRDTMRPSALAHLKGAGVPRGEDGHMLKAMIDGNPLLGVPGRVKGAIGGGDRSTLLGRLVNETLDNIHRRVKAAGLTDTVMMDDKGKLVEVSWDNVIDELGAKAERYAATMEKRTITAGTPTALDIIWRTADRAAADIAAVKATGLVPDTVNHKALYGAADLVQGEHWAHMTNQVSIPAKEFFTATDQVGSLWKSMAVARPGFSNRNYWGGLANNLAYGVSVRWHRRAAHMADQFFKDPTLLSPEHAEAIRILGSDVTNRGVSAADIAGGRIPFDTNRVRKTASAMQQGFELGVPFTGPISGKAKRANPLSFTRRLVGGASTDVPVELNLRLAAYLKFTDDGLSPEAARALVEQIHFDYQDLSKIDKSAKTIYPFWTWRSRNLGLQASHVIKGQGLSRGVIDAMVSARMEHEGEAFPPFLQGLQVPLGGGLVGSSSALPIADLISRVQDASKLAQGQVGDALRPVLIDDALPQLSAPFEILSKRNSFTGATRPDTLPVVLDTLLTSFVPGADLLPSPFPRTGRGSSVMKRSSVSDDLRWRIFENVMLRQTAYVPGGADVRDYSDTVN